MENFQFANRRTATRRIGIALTQIAAVVLILATAFPAMADNHRSVKMMVTPVYPEIAKDMKVAGPVEIDVTVDPNGKVTDVKTLSGNHLLAAAAADAVRKWKYAPSSTSTNESVVINFIPKN